MREFIENNKKRILIGAVVGAILIILMIVIPVALVVRSKSEDNGGTGKKPFDPANLPADELARIDCFLEAESKFENLTKYACEQRGCIFKPSEYERVPTCFFDTQKLGYQLDSKPSTGEYKLRLKPAAKLPYISGIKNLRLSVEYLGNSIIHVKV